LVAIEACMRELAVPKSLAGLGPRLARALALVAICLVAVAPLSVRAAPPGTTSPPVDEDEELGPPPADEDEQPPPATNEDEDEQPPGSEASDDEDEADADEDAAPPPDEAGIEIPPDIEQEAPVPPVPAGPRPDEPEPPEPRGPGETGEAASLLPGTGCDLRNRGDPLYGVVEALSLMRTGDLELVRCDQVVETGGGPRMIEAVLRGPDQDLLLYRLERLAADGFEVFLAPVDTHEVLMAARPALTGGGVFYVDVQQVSLHGTFVEGDDANRVETIIGLRQGNFYPFEYATRLAELGYRAEFYPVGPGEIVIEVRPGRSIRRVRVRGHIPLAKRDIVRQLSIDAQPGALARGQCVEPKHLRQGAPPPICDVRDVACLEWERDEIERLDQFLFDSGYFDGSSSLALVCGRAGDEADLYVFLNKGKAYKVDRQRVKVRDLDAEQAGPSGGEPLEDRDVRWIRRQFIPRVLGVFRTRITREFMDKAREKVISAYADPNAGLGRFWRSEAATPHPEIEVHTSYEDLDEESTFDSHNIPLEVRVERGPAVQTEFKPAREAAKHRRIRESGLRFSDGQLRSHIQLFNRREPASQAAAEREAANIRAFYQSKGYLFARVEGEHLDFKSMDKLRFEVAEGPKVEIAEISITRPARLEETVAKRIERKWEDQRHLRKRGKFSESDALEDIQSVLAAYNSEGYLCADVYIYVAFWKDALDPPEDGDLPPEQRPKVRAKLTIQDLLDSGGKAKWIDKFDPAGLAGVLAAKRANIWVRVHVDPGPRLVTADSEELRFLEEPIPFARKIEDPLLREQANRELAAAIVERSPLRRKGKSEAGNVPLTPSLDRDVRSSIVTQYRGRGYPIADAELTWRYTSPSGEALSADAARNLPDARYGICLGRQSEASVQVEPVLNIYEGKPGEFGEILFRGNFKTRDWVLRRELEFKTGEPYDQRLVDASAASIEASGVAKSVTITPYPVGCEFTEPGVCQVHQVVTMEEAKDISMAIDFGFGAATLNPFYVFANPSFPNIGGTGWDLSLEGRWGFDLSQALEETDVCAGQECYERLAAATISRPHVFGTELDLDINGRVQQRATPARGRILTVVGSLRVNRRFRKWTFYAGYLFQLANLSKDLAKPLAGINEAWINRGGGVVTDLTGLVDTGVVLNRVDNALNPHEGFMATMDIKLASPWLGGHDWWARLDLSWRHFIPLPIPGTQERLTFLYSLRYGHLVPFHGPGFGRRMIETDTVPEVWRYYGGGTTDLGLRGILPETMLVDVEEIQLPYGGTIYRPRAQGGHIRAIGTVALQVTSVRDIFGGALAHSIFYDFGVLTQFWSKVNLARDFRHSVGTNFIKLDIGIVTMAIGYAILLPGKYNVGPTDDPNGRFIFDVGVTF
jgi:outer membrane protein assembly factor BamA